MIDLMILYRIKKFLSQETNTEKVRVKEALLDWFIKWEEVDTGVDDLKSRYFSYNSLYYDIFF